MKSMRIRLKEEQYLRNLKMKWTKLLISKTCIVLASICQNEKLKMRPAMERRNAANELREKNNFRS